MQELIESLSCVWVFVCNILVQCVGFMFVHMCLCVCMFLCVFRIYKKIDSEIGKRKQTGPRAKTVSIH